MPRRHARDVEHEPLPDPVIEESRAGPFRIAAAAVAAMKKAEPQLMRAAQQNVIHKNAASRKVSRLTHAIAKLAK